MDLPTLKLIHNTISDKASSRSANLCLLCNFWGRHSENSDVVFRRKIQQLVSGRQNFSIFSGRQHFNIFSGRQPEINRRFHLCVSGSCRAGCKVTITTSLYRKTKTIITSSLLLFYLNHHLLKWSKSSPYSSFSCHCHLDIYKNSVQ